MTAQDDESKHYEDEWEAFVARERARAQLQQGLAISSDGSGSADGNGNDKPPTRRRSKVILVAVALAVIGVGVYGLTRSGSSGSGARKDTAAATPRATALASPAAAPPSAQTSSSASPSGSPSAPAAVGAQRSTSAISLTEAYPDRHVTLPSGAVYDLVATNTADDCRAMMSQPLSDVVDQGQGCRQMIEGLYTDADHSRQITITVLTMNAPEDAQTIFGLAAEDPATYQVAVLDPPPTSGIPAAPAGARGGLARLMTVHSVVFSNWLYTDGDTKVDPSFTQDGQQLLSYVDGKVAAYEQSDVTTT